MRKGKLFVFEGVDFVGKTTTSRKVAETYEFEYLKTPDPDNALSSLRDYIDNECSPLTRFFYYNMCSLDFSEKKLNTVLSEKNVCLDRYFPSALAYHNILLGKDMGSYIRDLNFVQPDILFLLIAEEATIIERSKNRNSATSDKKYEKDMNLLKKVQNEFLRLYENKAVIVNTSLMNVEETIRFVGEKIENLL